MFSQQGVMRKCFHMTAGKNVGAKFPRCFWENFIPPHSNSRKWRHRAFSTI